MPVPPPRPMPRVVVHELFGGGEHEHGVAAGVAVGDQIDRAACRACRSMYFGSARFLRSSSSAAELSRCGQPGQNVGVRETIFSSNHLRASACWPCGCDPARRVSRPLRSSAGISSVALISGMRICASTEGFSPRVSGMPASPRGKALAEQPAGRSRRLLGGKRVKQPVADVLLEEAAAFLDDDHVLAELARTRRRAARRRDSSCPSAGWGTRRSGRGRPARARGTARPCR